MKEAFLRPARLMRMGQSPTDGAGASSAAAAAAQAAAVQAAQQGAPQLQPFQPQTVDGSPVTDLEIHGAIVKVRVSPPPGAQGQPQEVMAMIDTGASISGVRPDIAQSAGLVQTSSVRIGGVVGSEERPIYASALDLPEYGIHFDAVEIAGVDLPQQDIQFLIGRDMLKKMQLQYNGPDANFSLASPQSTLLSTIVSGGVAALAFGSLFWIASGSK